MQIQRHPGILLLGLVLALPALGQADGDEESAFRGSFTLGWRSVDVGGREEKYRQHINLDDGASLFGLDFLYEPQSDLADEVRLEISSLGSQPYESVDFSIRKFGQYHFTMGRRESEYFYEDLILPIAESSPSLSNGGDFHHFDYRRVRDFARLQFRFTPRARLDVGFDRYTKSGENTTTLDISRDEFEFEAPMDQREDRIAVAFQYAWDKATLVLRETYQEFENARTLFLPGRSLGENTTNATILDFYFLDQPTDLESNQHHVALNLKPTKKWIVKLSGSVFDLELDQGISERGSGIAFNGAPLTISGTGRADVERDIELFDVDASYLLNPRVALVAGARSHQLDQDGDVAFGGSTSTAWEIDTTTLHLGVEVAVAEGVTLGGGVLEESREVTEEIGSGGSVSRLEEETDHTGLYLSGAWEASERLRFDARFEDSSYDDPFTLSSPTDRQRFRLQGRFQTDRGFFASGTYLAHRVDNENSDWQSDYDSVSVRGGYRDGRLEASVGYSLVEADRTVDQTVTTAPGFGGGQQFLFPVFFESEADFLDCYARWRASDLVALGASVRLFDNEGDFGREQEDFRIFADFTLPSRYLLHVGYRMVDYEEPVRGFNDYDADIVELGVGYRFD